MSPFPLKAIRNSMAIFSFEYSLPRGFSGFRLVPLSCPFLGNSPFLFPPLHRLPSSKTCLELLTRPSRKAAILRDRSSLYKASRPPPPAPCLLSPAQAHLSRLRLAPFFLPVPLNFCHTTLRFPPSRIAGSFNPPSFPF